MITSPGLLVYNHSVTYGVMKTPYDAFILLLDDYMYAALYILRGEFKTSFVVKVIHCNVRDGEESRCNPNYIAIKQLVPDHNPPARRKPDSYHIHPKRKVVAIKLSDETVQTCIATGKLNDI